MLLMIQIKEVQEHRRRQMLHSWRGVQVPFLSWWIPFLGLICHLLVRLLNALIFLRNSSASEPLCFSIYLTLLTLSSHPFYCSSPSLFSAPSLTLSPSPALSVFLSGGGGVLFSYSVRCSCMRGQLAHHDGGERLHAGHCDCQLRG